MHDRRSQTTQEQLSLISNYIVVSSVQFAQNWRRGEANVNIGKGTRAWRTQGLLEMRLLEIIGYVTPIFK